MIKWLKQPHWVRWDGKNGHAGVYYDPFWAVNASVTVNGNDLGVAFQLVSGPRGNASDCQRQRTARLATFVRLICSNGE